MTTVKPGDPLTQTPNALYRQRRRSQLLETTTADQIRLGRTYSTRKAIREHDDEPDLTVPTVGLFSSHYLPDKRMTSARESDVAG